MKQGIREQVRALELLTEEQNQALALFAEAFREEGKQRQGRDRAHE